MLIAALGIGGFLFYRQSNPAPPAAPLFKEDPANEPIAGAAECLSQNAVYRLRGDPRVSLQFAANEGYTGAPPAGNVLVGDQIVGNPLLFVVRVSTTQSEYRFAPHITEGYQRIFLYPILDGRLQRLRDVDQIEVTHFDAEYDVTPGMLRPDHATPDHIFMPDMTRYIYNLGGPRRIDSPVGFFDFDHCETPPAQ